jgi:RNA polymerase sigma-70 factor (ECF subfamily)
MSPRHLAHATDAELVALARQGAEDAFDALFRRHVARVAGVCRKRVPTADVDDIVQDVFVRAHTHLHQLRDADSFGPWIRSIAVRRCAELHRGPRLRMVVAGSEDDALGVADETAMVDDHVERAETARRVHDNLLTLSARDREALWLRDALDVPIADIAARFGTTEGSTRVLLTRARRRMRAAYVAVVAWIAGASLRARQWLALVPDVAPTAAGAVAVPALVLAVVIGSVGATNIESAPVTPVAPAPVVAPQVEADSPNTGPLAAAEGHARLHHDATLLAPQAHSSPAADRPLAPIDDVHVSREPASDDETVYEATVEDGETTLLGVFLDGGSGAESSGGDDGTDEVDDDESDDSAKDCNLLDLVRQGCGRE